MFSSLAPLSKFGKDLTRFLLVRTQREGSRSGTLGFYIGETQERKESEELEREREFKTE